MEAPQDGKQKRYDLKLKSMWKHLNMENKQNSAIYGFEGQHFKSFTIFMNI